MTSDNKDTTVFFVKIIVVLAIITLVIWGLVSVFKRLGEKFEEKVEEGIEPIYGKTNASVPQGAWIGPDLDTGNYNEPLTSAQMGSKGWADMENLPSTMNPLSADFVSSNPQINSTAATSIAQAINEKIHEFWHIPFITHQGDEILNLLQEQPNKTFIYGISQTYKALFNTTLMDDLQSALTDTMKDALAKIIMTKTN